MPINLYSAAFAFVVLLAGCASTPPGKLKESDFATPRMIALEMPVQQAISNLFTGLRYCGSESGGVVFVTHHGVAECPPVSANGKITCDLFVGQPGGGRSGTVLGRIDFAPVGQSSTATMHVRTYAANQSAVMNSWEKFIRGQEKDVCPD